MEFGTTLTDFAVCISKLARLNSQCKTSFNAALKGIIKDQEILSDSNNWIENICFRQNNSSHFLILFKTGISYIDVQFI